MNKLTDPLAHPKEIAVNNNVVLPFTMIKARLLQNFPSFAAVDRKLLGCRTVEMEVGRKLVALLPLKTHAIGMFLQLITCKSKNSMIAVSLGKQYCSLRNCASNVKDRLPTSTTFLMQWKKTTAVFSSWSDRRFSFMKYSAVLGIFTIQIFFYYFFFSWRTTTTDCFIWTFPQPSTLPYPCRNSDAWPTSAIAPCEEEKIQMKTNEITHDFDFISSYFILWEKWIFIFLDNRYIFPVVCLFFLGGKASLFFRAAIPLNRKTKLPSAYSRKFCQLYYKAVVFQRKLTTKQPAIAWRRNNTLLTWSSRMMDARKSFPSPWLEAMYIGVSTHSYDRHVLSDNFIRISLKCSFCTFLEIQLLLVPVLACLRCVSNVLSHNINMKSVSFSSIKLTKWGGGRW